MRHLRAWALITGIALAAVIGLIVAFNMSGSGTDAPTAFAGVPTPTPKPNGLGNLSGIYDAQVHNNNKAQGLFHCMLRLDHDSITNAVKAAAQCYLDIPGQVPGNPLVDTADVIPGPPPPPPYITAAPTKFNGTFNPGTDTLNLTGCFADIGSSLGPNLIFDVTIPNAKATLATGILSGTVLINLRESNAQCAAKTPSGTPPAPLNVNLYKAGGANPAPWRDSATDYDGDGCTDSDELAKPGSTGNCGDDPYNPLDSDTSINGPFNLTVTSIPADWDKTNNVLIPGSYFHCIGNTIQTGLNVDVNVQCYTDSPALAGLGGSPLKTDSNGLAGAPPPPPFTLEPPTKATGTITGKVATSIACFANVGGALGPNIIAVTTLDINTGQGSVDIFPAQENDNCDANPPTPKGSPSINDAPLASTEQDANWDSDEDACSDAQELAKPHVKGCGDDPYNSLDSDDDLNAALDIEVTAVRADADTTPAEAGAECTDTQDNDLDFYVNDGCPAVATSPAETQAQCANNTDDDKDGRVNDGCPAAALGGLGETGTLCENNTDDDKDGAINDGCAQTTNFESGAQCANDTNDDPGADGRVNDGCPPVTTAGGVPETGTQCGNAADDDGDNAVNDGCARQGSFDDNEAVFEECGGNMDASDEDPAAGPAFDDDAAVNDGCPAAVLGPGDETLLPLWCTNNTDDDKDGAVNDGCPAVKGADFETTAGGQCSNNVDDDGDGRVNDGCPPVTTTGGVPENPVTQCANSTDNDGDNSINDGCPAVFVDPTPAESGAQCENGTDDDQDGSVNDGCPERALQPGFYFHCVADIQHTNPGTTNNLAARVLCYTDNALTTVNCQDAANSVASPCATAIICQPFGEARKSRCGDGLPGVPPPSNDPDAGGPGGTAYADIDATHTVLSGQLDKPNNEIELEGCFAGVENPLLGPNIYARTVIDSDTGQGTVDIWLNQGSCAVPGGAPTYNDAAIRIAEQAPNKTAKPETACKDAIDDDLDGFVNDGCPETGNAGEFGFQCNDALNQNKFDVAVGKANEDDNGSFLNHNQAGAPPLGDKDPNPPAGGVNDGCPARGPLVNPIAVGGQRDSDLDSCADAQELRDAFSPGPGGPQQRGGLRDPLNRWDLMFVYHGSPLIKDKAVNASDLSAVVARFGATDTGAGTFDRNSNPTLTPNLPITPSGNRANYRPSFDRDGTLVGSNAWNLKPPNGNVGAPELANTVAQFGHNCNI